MQTMRREWINEGKPRQAVEEDAVSDEPTVRDKQGYEVPDVTPSGSLNPARPQTPPPAESLDDDLYSATPQAVQEQRRKTREADAEKNLFISDDDDAGGEPSGDELDALLAEDGFQEQAGTPHTTMPPDTSHADARREDTFDDEMEAMAGMDDMW